MERVVPPGSRVMGAAFYWFVLRDRELVVPLFMDAKKDPEELRALAGSLEPDYVLLTRTDDGTWERGPFLAYTEECQPVASFRVRGRAGIWRERRARVLGVVVMKPPSD